MYLFLKLYLAYGKHMKNFLRKKILSTSMTLLLSRLDYFNQETTCLNGVKTNGSMYTSMSTKTQTTRNTYFQNLLPISIKIFAQLGMAIRTSIHGEAQTFKIFSTLKKTIQKHTL